MHRLKQVVGWLAAAVVAGAIGVGLWNLPQGQVQAVPAGDDGDRVLIGRVEPGFDAAAEASATKEEQLRTVRGLHLSDGDG